MSEYRDRFDPAHLAVDPGAINSSRTAKRKKLSTRPNLYIQVPVEWHRRAVEACRSAKGLATALLIYRAAVTRRTLSPKMPTKALKDHGINRQIRRRALVDLADAGLIELEPRPNKNPRITIRCEWLMEEVQ